MDALERGERVLASRPELPSASIEISFVEFVAMTAALMALTALSIDIMLPALPQIGVALGVASENERQLIVILYMAGFAVGQVFFGPLSDHFGRKPVLLLGLMILIVGTLGALLSETFAALLAARVIQGLGAASARVIAVAVVRDLYKGRQMARVMSFAMMVFIVIPVLAPSLGQALIHVGNWRLTFFALLAMSSLTALWAGLRLPETGRQALGLERMSTLRESFAAAIFEPVTLAYGVASGFMFGCLLAYVASAQQVFVEVFDMGQAFPIAFGAIASAMAVASFLNARLVGQLGMRKVSHSALAGFIVVALALTATSARPVASLWIFAPLIATSFFLFGLIAPNFNAIAMEPQGRNAGTASSVIGSLSTAIGALAGGLVGSFFNGSVLPISAGFAACSLIAGVIVFSVEGRRGLLGRNRSA